MYVSRSRHFITADWSLSPQISSASPLSYVAEMNLKEAHTECISSRYTGGVIVPWTLSIVGQDHSFNVRAGVRSCSLLVLLLYFSYAIEVI